MEICRFAVLVGLVGTVLSGTCRGQIIMESSDPAQRVGTKKAGGENGQSDAFCADSYSLKKGSVVQMSKSEKLGGRLLNATSGLTSEDCLRRCCHTAHCTVAAYEAQGRLACYLFDCGDLDDFRCEVVPYSDYEVAILTVSRRELGQHVDNVVAPTPRLLAAKKNSMAQALSHSEETPSRCSRYEFQCRTSGECIARYDRCNGAFECPDRSDEYNCDEYRQELYRQAQEKELRNSQRNPVELDLEDDLRAHSNDADAESPMWDRGRNRIADDTTPAVEKSTGPWKFGLATTAPHLPAPAVKTSPADRKLASPVIQSTTPVSGIPLDRIATTISIISTTNPHDIQHIHIEKSSPSASTVPAWINFSDPSHFVISVILIFAIGFCLGMTLFVVCRCICNRKPKVTKYKIVDPEAEDFLLGGTYG